MKSFECYIPRHFRAASYFWGSLLLASFALAGCSEKSDPVLSDRAGGSDLEQTASTYGKHVPVILVVMDALDASHVTHLGYGRDTTPFMDAFAKDGVSFRAAFSPAPYTVAGIGSLLTGRRPDTTGLYTKMNMLREDEMPIAAVLSRNGYLTRALVNNPNGGMRFGALRGFDEVSTLYEPAEDAKPNFTTRDGVEVHLPQAPEHLPHMRAFLDRVPEVAPFFFYAHMLEPHSPYVADEPFRSQFLDPNYNGIFLKGDTDDLLDTVYGRLDANAEDRLAITALYDGHLSFADHSFGALMDDLRARGLYEESLIILTGDHGEAMFQHGRWGHNDHIYDEMIHVPLIVKLPGTEGPRNVIMENLVSTMDVLPTICETLDLAPGDLPLDGKSLYSSLQSGAEPEGSRGLFLRTHHSSPDVALRTNDAKGIFLRNDEGPPRFEFYDLSTDPKEELDLGRTDAPEVAAMKNAILAEYARLKASRLRALSNDKVEDSATTLGALGYTDEVNAAAEGQLDPLSESLVDPQKDDIEHD